MATIKEDYVSFETAKLLKEKGFNEPCFRRYVYGVPVEHGVSDKLCYFRNIGLSKEECTAPNLAHVMKWLREVHNLVVNPVTTSESLKDVYGKWEVDIYYYDSGIDATENACGHIFRNTYEDVCEAGINYCLEHLI